MENEIKKKNYVFYGIIILVILFVGYKFISEFTLIFAESPIGIVDEPTSTNITPEITPENITSEPATENVTKLDVTETDNTSNNTS